VKNGDGIAVLLALPARPFRTENSNITYHYRKRDPFILSKKATVFTIHNNMTIKNE
jgi:hypothetical protein